MAVATNKFIEIEPGQYVRQVWKKDSTLFGLLRCDRMIHEEKMGESLRIAIERVPEEIVVNGVKYSPAK